MNSDYLFENIKGLFNRWGFNITRKVKTSDYSNNLKTTRALYDFPRNGRSIILAGFAGSGFWDILRAFLKNETEFAQSRIDWIDDYTRIIFRSAEEILERSRVSYEVIFPFGARALSLDFMELGRIAGVGVDSLLGILLNPEYGPWISLRGAIITDLEFSNYDNPLKNFDPCPPCPKPCITACPAKTISDGGWAWEACIDYRLSTDTCTINCASRRACPYGKEHQYTEEQLVHHHKFVLSSVKQHRANKA